MGFFKLLVAKRAATKTFLPGIYELVGGHVEFGETLENALIREFKEELHIDVIIRNPFYAFTYLADGNTNHIVEVDFFVYMKDPNQPIILNPQDHSEYKWITQEEVHNYFADNDDEKKAILQGFKKYPGSRIKSGMTFLSNPK